MSSTRNRIDAILLWVAQGFGVGRIPVAPGTFGSVLGILWSLLLCWSGSLILYSIFTFAGLGLCVWISHHSERIMGEKDPGSVVIDEIAAVPLCFLPTLCIDALRGEPFPTAEGLLKEWHGAWIVLAFLLFRAFDIYKPGPIAKLQNLPRGWGITADDVAAAGLAGVLLSLSRLN